MKNPLAGNWKVQRGRKKSVLEFVSLKEQSQDRARQKCLQCSAVVAASDQFYKVDTCWTGQ